MIAKKVDSAPPAEQQGTFGVGRPGIGKDIRPVLPEDTRVDPNVIHERPGYEENGAPKIVPIDEVQDESPLQTKAIGIVSVIAGFLGGVFYWWTPLGMVLSLTGLLVGFVAWLNAAPRTRNRAVALVGMILSAATFVLDIVIAILGLELIQLMSYR